MPSTSKKLNPEFRSLLHQLTIEFLSKTPEDFIEFAIEFLKKKEREKIVKLKKMEASKISLEEDIGSYDDALDGYNYARNNILEVGFDLESEYDKQVIYKTDEQREKISTELCKIMIFKLLHDEDFQFLVDVMEKKEVLQDEILIKQGDEGDYFYVVECGDYIAYKEKTQDKDETVLARYHDGGCFGELALLYNVPRSCTVRAETRGILWFIDRVTFRQIVVKGAKARRHQYTEFLAKVPLLSGLADSERTDLADCLESRVYPPGHRIIHEGEPADGMYFILTGTARVTIMKGPKNIELEVKRLTAGDYFGELALITHKPRAASVYALDEVNAAFLDVQSFERLLGPCLDIMRRNIASYDSQTNQVLTSTK